MKDSFQSSLIRARDDDDDVDIDTGVDAR